MRVSIGVSSSYQNAYGVEGAKGRETEGDKSREEGSVFLAGLKISGREEGRLVRDEERGCGNKRERSGEHDSARAWLRTVNGSGPVGARIVAPLLRQQRPCPPRDGCHSFSRWLEGHVARSKGEEKSNTRGGVGPGWEHQAQPVISLPCRGAPEDGKDAEPPARYSRRSTTGRTAVLTVVLVVQVVVVTEL